MKKLSKLAALLLAICLLATLLTGCSSSTAPSVTPPSSDNPATDTPTDTPTETPNADEPVTLNVLLSGPGTLVDTQLVVDEFNKMLADYLPNTTVNMEFVLGTDYEQRLRLALSASESIDVANLHSGGGEAANTLVGEARKGTMMSLDDLLASVPDLVNTIPEGTWSRAKVDGVTYMVPINAMITDRFIGLKTPKGLADEYLDVAGLKALMETNNGPVTQGIYDILTDYLAALKDSGNIQRGVSIETTRWLADRGFYPILDTTFVARREETGGVTVLNVWETEEYNLMFQNHADWFKAGYIEQDIMSMQDRRQYERKPDGAILAMTTQFLDLPQFPTFNPDAVDTGNYGYDVATIAWNKNYFITPSGTSMQGLIIPKTSQNPQRAMEFISVLNTNQELAQLLNQGIEGVHYERDENGNIQKFVEDDSQARYLGYGWNYANTLMPDPKSNDGATYVEYVNYVMDDAVVTPVAGFQPDIEAVKMELTRFESVRQEYALSLYSGAMDNWEARRDEMIQKMKDAGSEAIVAELQRQVDEYLAANQ